MADFTRKMVVHAPGQLDTYKPSPWFTELQELQGIALEQINPSKDYILWYRFVLGIPLKGKYTPQGSKDTISFELSKPSTLSLRSQSQKTLDELCLQLEGLGWEQEVN